MRSTEARAREAGPWDEDALPPDTVGQPGLPAHAAAFGEKLRAVRKAKHMTLQELARRATIWLFPLYEMVKLRWRATADETNPQRQRLNRFRHVTQIGGRDNGPGTATRHRVASVR